jgi:hypothetical protein
VRRATPDQLRAIVRGRIGDRDPHERKDPVKVIWGRPTFGYHTEGDSLVISAPRCAFAPAGKSWGIFAPVYAAVWSERRMS